MATRRTRIVGIANIPQRRKVEKKPNEDPPVPIKPESIEVDAKIINKSELEELPRENNLAIQQSENNEVKPNIDLPRRRTFIKPAVNPKILSQKSKLKLESVETKPVAVEVLPELTEQNVIDEQRVAALQTPLNIPISNIKATSDTEYPIPPLSPTKLVNRSRIKAVPRLGQRRSSTTLHGSASESEDDGRKTYKRIRTESVCSTVSVTNEPPIKTDATSPHKNKEFSSVIQRKCKRTEQSRKMAEARRHFLHKFGNQTPDKQKLTMIDLIFYNPTTNPMCQKPKKQPTDGSDEDEDNLESTEKVEEQVIEPEDANIESDEENAVPAPQIKIGANGEIVVDEKSLTIENIETKRSREELQKSKIVDGDFDTGYGIYKREKRSKDWSKEETLRFYKALNTLGPDFSLMVELFAGRSRRELKMKFKKEERVNRLLVDKALTQPVQFDITELLREVEEDQKRIEEEEEQRNNPAKKPIPYYGQRRKATARVKQQVKFEPLEKKPQDMYSKLEKGISCLWESDTEDEPSEAPSSKPPPQLKPTRSGRIPKPRQPYTPNKDLIVAKKKPISDSEPETQENTFKDLNALQPGSIMIVSSQTPTGEPTFKVFMVTPTQKQIPITLTPDMLTNLTQTPEEENITIPAEENNENLVEQEMWPYELDNIRVPEEKDVTLPEDKSVIFSTDGKYDIRLSREYSEERILPV